MKHTQNLENLNLALSQIRKYRAKKNKHIQFQVSIVSYMVWEVPDSEALNETYEFEVTDVIITGDKLQLEIDSDKYISYYVAGGGKFMIDKETGKAILLHTMDYATYSTKVRVEKIDRLLDFLEKHDKTSN